MGWGVLFQHLWLPARSFPSLTPGRIAFFSAKSPSVPVLQGHLSLPTQDSLPISRSIITSANGLFSYSITITGLRVLGSGPLGGHRLGCCRSVVKEEEEVAGGERAGSMYQHLKHAWCLVGAPSALVEILVYTSSYGILIFHCILILSFSEEDLAGRKEG